MTLKLSNSTPSSWMVVAFGDIEPGEMPPTSAWWPREATQNRISPPLPPPGGGRSPREARRERVVFLLDFTPPRLAALADPPPPGEGGSANTGVHTVMSGRCVPP